MNEVIIKKQKKKKDGKLSAWDYIVLFHKFSIKQIIKWVGKWAIIIGLIVAFWVMHTKDIGTEQEKMFNFLVMFKWIGRYLLRFILKISFVYLLMVIMWLLNLKEWKRYINDKTNQVS